ncbi:hypothetical protein ACRW58_23795, partial [Escherichia coli]
SSGAGRTSDGNGSHASTLKSPSYTKSVSWQHYPDTPHCYFHLPLYTLRLFPRTKQNVYAWLSK